MKKISILNRFRKLWTETNPEAPLPCDPIKVGSLVDYLGVEWTVTTRRAYSWDFKLFTLSRITPLGNLETVSPDFHSKLVTLKK